MKLPGFIRFLFSKDKEFAYSLRNILGFFPNNVYLYHLALRHKSAAIEISEGKKICNERLEYLGDAVLNAIIADFLFFKYPFKDEGYLTQMRSKLVSRNHLNKLSVKLGINQMIKTDCDVSGAFRSMSGDAFEALIGAIYIDKGYRFTKKVIIDRIIKLHIDLDEIEQKELNFKSKLIEYVQREKVSLEFRVIGETGKGYSKQYIVEVFVDNKSMGKGMGYTIKNAEQSAAEIACSQLIL